MEFVIFILLFTFNMNDDLRSAHHLLLEYFKEEYVNSHLSFNQLDEHGDDFSSNLLLILAASFLIFGLDGPRHHRTHCHFGKTSLCDQALFELI
jgi:hypothetical protein